MDPRVCPLLSYYNIGVGMAVILSQHSDSSSQHSDSSIQHSGISSLHSLATTIRMLIRMLAL